MKKLLEKTFKKAIYIDTHQNYSDKDLFNVTFIFSHVLLDVMYTVNNKITGKQKMKFAKSCGEEIRELIYGYTDKDMKKIAKKLLNDLSPTKNKSPCYN